MIAEVAAAIGCPTAFWLEVFFMIGLRFKLDSPRSRLLNPVAAKPLSGGMPRMAAVSRPLEARRLETTLAISRVGSRLSRAWASSGWKRACRCWGTDPRLRAYVKRGREDELRSVKPAVLALKPSLGQRWPWSRGFRRRRPCFEQS